MDIIVDNETGLLVPPGDVQALQAAIEYMLRNPQERARMGESGRQRVALLQEGTVIARIEQVYREVMSL